MSDDPTILPASPEVDQRYDLYREAFRRGLLPPDKAKIWEEGERRGLFGSPQVKPSGVNVPGGALQPESPAPRDPAVREAEVRGGLAANPEQDMRLLQGYDPSVDYDTGTGWNDIVTMYQSDNPREKQAYLARKYGPDNVFTDRGGRFVVRSPDDGKLRAVEGGDVSNLLMQSGAQLVANPAVTVGAGIGGVMGAPAGGPLGAMAGAAMGGAAGKTLQEGVKYATGGYRKTVPELVSSIGTAGVLEAGGEGLGRLVTGLPGMAGRFFRDRVAGVTPESRELAGQTLRSGGIVPIGSVAPGLKPAQFTENVASRLGYNYTDDPNLAAVLGRLRGMVDEVFPPSGRAGAMEEILDPASRVSSREAGVPILGNVRQHAAQLEAEVENLTRDVDRMLNQQLNQLSAVSRRAPAGDLGTDVATAIAQARTDFGRSMQSIYARVDQATGGAEIVPTGAIRREADRVLRALPTDAQGNPIFGDQRVLRSIQQLRDLGPNMTLADAQSIRSTLAEFGSLTDLTPGVAKRQFGDLRTSVNTAINIAARDPAAAPAINMLRRADQMYHDGIRRFEDATINQMVNQARTGIMPDPGVIAEKVLAPGNLSRARTIREMVGPDVWRRVASADMDNMLGPGGSAIDPQTGEVMARKFATLIAAKDKSGMLELTYGPRMAREMRLYSQRLDARGGKFPAEGLTPDNFGQTMRQLERANLERDTFLETNYLSALADPKNLPDDAVNFVLRPGKEERLERALRFFGKDSSQMHAIQTQALKEVMSKSVVQADSGGTTVAGKSLEDALKPWTPRQQEIMFPDGLASDMKSLAREIRFMFPRRGEEFGGGLAAGAISSLPGPARFVASLPFSVPAWIMTRPSVTRVIANGLAPSRGRGEILAQARQDVVEMVQQGRVPAAVAKGLLGLATAAVPTRAETRETIRMLFRAEAAGQLPSPDEEPEPGVMSWGGATLEAGQRSRLPPRDRPPIPTGLRPARELRPSVSGP